MNVGSIAAVVVTFNRKDLLCECLDGLLKQTHGLNQILVIDNASTDGTGHLLAERGYLTDDRIDYVRMAANTGGAGGFNEGVKRGHEKGFDWLWLMDDDVEPVPDALERMIACRSMSKCIQGSKWFTDGRSEGWERWANLDRSGARTAAKPDQVGDVIRVQTGCFEGMLIHREIVGEIGFPDTRFFIGGDDVAYGYLASQHTQIVYVKETCFLKKINKCPDQHLIPRLLARLHERRSARYYFLIVRNEFLLYSYTRPVVQISRYLFRVGGLLIRYSAVTLLMERSMANFRALWRGARDGYNLLRATHATSA